MKGQQAGKTHVATFGELGRSLSIDFSNNVVYELINGAITIAIDVSNDGWARIIHESGELAGRVTSDRSTCTYSAKCVVPECLLERKIISVTRDAAKCDARFKDVGERCCAWKLYARVELDVNGTTNVQMTSRKFKPFSVPRPTVSPAADTIFPASGLKANFKRPTKSTNLRCSENSGSECQLIVT